MFPRLEIEGTEVYVRQPAWETIYDYFQNFIIIQDPEPGTSQF